jgi:hypothetical protein
VGLREALCRRGGGVRLAELSPVLLVLLLDFGEGDTGAAAEDALVLFPIMRVEQRLRMPSSSCRWPAK